MRKAVLGIVVLAFAAAPAAQADERIVAGFGNTYLTPNVTIDQGERLTFQNLDLPNHDVVSRQAGLFKTPLIGPGQEVPVEGAQSLTTGSYAFFCSIHPFMNGTVNVTSAGTPQPRPGGGGGSTASGDSTAPELTLSIRDSDASAVREARRLRVRAQVNEAGHVEVGAAVKGKLIARGQRHFGNAGSATIRLRLNKAGRKALRRSRKVTVSGTARDATGNAGPATAQRRLRR